MDSHLESFETRANGFTFTGLASGPEGGRPVMLLHGFPQTSWSWREELGALGAARFRAVAFDQRGYSSGARPGSVGDYGIDSLAADVLAVADAHGWESFDVVGHDWGAMVAWVIAARHEDRITTLSALSVPHPSAFAAALGDSDGEQAQRSSYIGVFRAEGGVAEKRLLGEDNSGDGLRTMFSATGLDPRSEDADRFVTAMLEPGAMTAALNWYRAMSRDAFAGIGPVAVPTLYVWSTADGAIGRKAAEATAAHVSGPYRFEVLEGVSHWIPETASEQLNALLLEHLGSHPVSS
ncbi:MAG: alpha/beta fold hydrolase [Acidimicrobiales bacterium]